MEGEMKKKALLVLIVVGLILLCSAEKAISAEKGFYISLGTGFGTAENINMTVPFFMFERDEIGNSVSFSGAIGYRISRNFRIDVEFCYYPDYALDETDHLEGIEVKANSEIRTFTAMTNIYYDFSIKGFTPFVGAGIGFSVNTLSDILNMLGTEYFQNIAIIGDGSSKTCLAWHAVVGGEVSIRDDLSLVLSYHYADLGEIQTGSSSFIDETVPLRTGDFRIHDFRVALRYKF